MLSPEEHALVCKSICAGISNCFFWDEGAALRVRNDPDLKGLTPRFIREAVRDYVRETGDHVVVEVVETRERWRDDFKFYYKVILPVDEFLYGIFVEMRLTDNDPDVPMVLIVNAHPQRK
ncbi:hypothetical protein [Paludisphaera rhizosphaerae]|uniref:hypothetical protein n=1 Tax=Paludisphaera rhizosphaerae TaxID=2711216 RepID=UPI0013EBC6F2|nr:hypothetical protein [Paludisphaera rhizosphaerae]